MRRYLIKVLVRQQILIHRKLGRRIRIGSYSNSAGKGHEEDVITIIPWKEPTTNQSLVLMVKVKIKVHFLKKSL